MAAPVLRPLSTGEVLDVSFGLYRALFLPLIIVALVCRAIPAIVQVYIDTSGGFSEHWPLALGNFLLGIVLSTIGVAASTFIVAKAYLGEETTANDALHNAVSLLWPLILLGVMTGLVVVVGFIMLVIPGLILTAGLLVATVALVLEQPLSPTGAMNRSWQLTRGFRAKVLGVFLVASLLFIIPTIMLGIVAGIITAVGGQSTLMVAAATAVLQIFVYPYTYVVLTVLYYDLRVRKEGFDLELLSAATQPA